MSNKLENAFLVGAALTPIVLILAIFAAWATHIIVCLKTGAWGFLIAGALFFPIGIVHGVGVWGGAW